MRPADRRVIHPLQRDTDRNGHAGMPGVVHVVPVMNVLHVDVVGFVPVHGPVLGPRINESEPKAVAAESWMPRDNHHGKGMESESVLPAEINNEPVMRDVVAAITAALLPIAMFILPVLCATLLPNHALFLARVYMLRTLAGMFSSLPSLQLNRTLLGTLRLLAAVLLTPARLFTFALVFVCIPLIALISTLAMRRNSGSEN
jgi:hypothetical protein